MANLGDSYLNDKRCREFIGSISAVQHLAVAERLIKQSPWFFSLIVDGGTDVSTKELELMYMRYLEQGTTVNRFS